MLKLIATAWLVLSLLKLSGFCFYQLGWKSDMELITAAFELEAAHTAADVPDVRGYLEAYPECCAVKELFSSEFISIPSALLNAIFLERFYQIEIKYPVRDPSQNRGESFFEAILTMECCGTYAPDWYGMPSSKPILKAVN